jgi:LacI family transcriptional regulator
MRIKDIALKANVSSGTVDRVIHDRKGVSEKTKKIIMEIIKKNNFKINYVASALNKKKEYIIATLIPNHDIDNMFWQSPFLGVEKASSEIKIFGFNVVNYKYSQTNVETYLNSFKKLLDKKPNGVIIVPSFKNATKNILKKLEKSKIPYFFLNINLKGFNNLSFIGQDSFKSGYLAGKLLHICLGDNPKFLTVKIASHLKNNDAIQNRIKGFEQYFIDKQVKSTSINIVFESIKFKIIISKKINAILKSNPEIKGIFVPSSRVGIVSSVLKKTSQQNLKVIGYDTTPDNLKCLNDDKITFLISQKSFNQGYNSIIYMSDFLFKKIIPEQKNFSPIEIVTKENITMNKWKNNLKK